MVVIRQAWVNTFKEAVEGATFIPVLAQYHPKTSTWAKNSQRMNHPKMNLSDGLIWALKRVASHSAVNIVMLRRLANRTSSSLRELALGM